MPSLQALECFHNLAKDADFQKGFREFVRELYRQGKHVEYGLPNKYTSFIRQMNRIKAFAEGSGRQSRSGRRMWEKGLGALVRDFLERSITIAGEECLQQTYGGRDLGQTKMVGLFQDLLTWDEYLDETNGVVDVRGPFSDFVSLRNYAGELMASAPLNLVIVCGQYVGILGSNPV